MSKSLAQFAPILKSIKRCGDCGEKFEHYSRVRRQAQNQKQFCDPCVDRRKREVANANYQRKRLAKSSGGK